jgi:hypothetical protein
MKHNVFTFFDSEIVFLSEKTEHFTALEFAVSSAWEFSKCIIGKDLNLEKMLTRKNIFMYKM